ncbi:hypothetical protein ACHWQZ_G005695 [Mnemiopsis leidyi]
MEEGYDNNVQPGSCPEEENDYGASQYVNNLLHSEWEGEEMEDPGFNLADLTPEEREVYELKMQLQEKRQNVCDTSLFNEAQTAQPVAVKIRRRRDLKGHLTKVYAMDWCTDARHVLSASQDSRLLVWDTYSGNKIHAIELKCSWVMCCSYAPSGNYVASGGLDNVCSVYDLNDEEGNLSGKAIKVLTGHDGYLGECQFLSDKQILTSSGDHMCILWDIATGHQITALKDHQGEVDCLSVLPDNNTFLSGSTDMTVKLWDLREGMCKQTLVGHQSDVVDCKWLSNGNNFVTASDDGIVRLFDIRSDQEIAQYSYEYPQAGVSCVDTSLSGRIIFAGYDDFNVILWDTLLGELVAVLSEHGAKVSCLGVDKDGVALCTGSWDNLLKIWN